MEDNAQSGQLRIEECPAHQPLKWLRARCGVGTPTEFARMLGIPVTTYKRYEEDVRKMPVSALLAICEKLNIGADEALGLTSRESGNSTLFRYEALSLEDRAFVDDIVRAVECNAATRRLGADPTQERRYEGLARYYEQQLIQAHPHLALDSPANTGIDELREEFSRFAQAKLEEELWRIAATDGRLEDDKDAQERFRKSTQRAVYRQLDAVMAAFYRIHAADGAKAPEECPYSLFDEGAVAEFIDRAMED